MLYYLAISVIFFTVGLMPLAGFKKSFLAFAFMVAIVPTSLAFGGQVVRFNFFSFEFYFVGLAISFLFGRGGVSAPSRFVVILSFIAAAIMASSAMYSISFTDNFKSVASFADIRLLLVLVEFALVYYQIQLSDGIDFDQLAMLTVCASISCLVFWLINYLGLLHFGDDYYDEVNRSRYKQVGTELAAIYPVIAAYFFGRGVSPGKALYQIAFWLSLAALVASGSRALIACVLLATAFAVTSPRVKLLLIACLALSLPVIGLEWATIFGPEGIGSTAISKAASDFVTRTSPANPYLQVITIKEFIFGNGFGSFFDIPWFRYRGLRPELGVLDSIHVTMFVKFGIFYIIILASYLSFYLSKLPRQLALSLFFYYIFMGITVAFIYRPGILLAGPILMAVGLSSRNNPVSDTNITGS